MELPTCPACRVSKGIESEMEYKDTYRNLQWFVCYKHTYPFFTTKYIEPQRTLDQWMRGDALIVILAGIPL